MTRAIAVTRSSLLSMAMSRLAFIMKWDIEFIEPGNMLRDGPRPSGSIDIVLLDASAAGLRGRKFFELVDLIGDFPVVAFVESGLDEGELSYLSDKARAVVVPETSETQMRAILMLVESGFDVKPSGISQSSSAIAASEASRLRKILTRREFAILAEIANGHSNKEIATRMRISSNTVNAHVSSIIHKLNVRNRVQAALLLRSQPGQTHGDQQRAA